MLAHHLFFHCNHIKNVDFSDPELGNKVTYIQSKKKAGSDRALYIRKLLNRLDYLYR